VVRKRGREREREGGREGREGREGERGREILSIIIDPFCECGKILKHYALFLAKV
jgi:hypothetical protein